MTRMQTCPIPSAYCPCCTDRQCKFSVSREHDDSDALALGNLIPAGTITVTVHDGELPCPGTTVYSHGWHSLPVRNLSTHPADTLFRQLAFLIEHLLLRATCRLGTSGHLIFIRLYLIPSDGPKIQGRLQRRSEAVVKEARRQLRNIVSMIERSSRSWDADEACLDSPREHFLLSHIDNRSMAEIYSALPSLTLSPPTNDTCLSNYVACGGDIWGLRTTLYGYQRHSVAIMLQKESSISPVPDPLYIPVACMSGTHCYIQPSTMSVVRERPAFSPSRAGILCEELGTGKTVMMIALILVTSKQLPDPEESLVDERPVMTPLAFRHFPSAQYALARERAGLDRGASQQVPSLVELLMHYFSLSKANTSRSPYADKLEASHLWPLVRANSAFYHQYNADFAVKALKKACRRNVPNLCPRVMYLSSSTLVIVPLNLLGQWKTEIDKHCHDYVRYLVVRPSMELPNARKLASDYDLIIMSDTRFRKESKKNNTEKLHSFKPCACPPLVESRVPDCRCPGDPEVSPLLQIRWKRLVIDEGHITANVAATINQFVRQLSIQHKWIVTGTPTSNILGLQLGRTTDETESDNRLDSDEFIFRYPESPVATSSKDDRCPTRIWGSYESLNLRKLGAMIGDFLAVPQFRADAKIFTAHVSMPLCDPHGPQPGAISVLSQVMQMVMVRHRIEDIENDVSLPPMKHSMVYMDLSEYALKSYNALQAGLAINAIDSEREGTDYLFHPSKTKDLQTAINNSLQGLFWSSSDILYNVDQICEEAGDFIERAVERNIDARDMDLLKQALKHAATAANDPIWRELQLISDVPFRVYGLDPAVFAAWTRTGLCNDGRTSDIIHPDRLIDLRSLVRKNALISKDYLCAEGDIVEMKERRFISMSGSRNEKHDVNRTVNQTKELTKEVQETIEALKRQIERTSSSSDEELHDKHCASRVTSATHKTKPSLLSGAKVGSSLSTKLNYILSEIQKYSSKEKFLIFSHSPLTLSQIGEALSLFEIKYLRYTNQEKYLLRQQCITTFETSDTHRVLLVELKLGARGLNLISASRIIFCEPIWHPDVESQAIKRAHRIGQTKPVTVKTLVIRSTAEEAMISRRQYLRSSELDKVPSMTTESGMREYLMYPSFLAKSASPSDSTDMVRSLDDDQAADMHSFVNEGFEVDDDNHSSGLGSDVTLPKRVRFE